MTGAVDIWAVVPVKDTAGAKTAARAGAARDLRQGLALAMLEDVLAALAETRGLAGLCWSRSTRPRAISPRATARAVSRMARATAIPARSRRRRGVSLPRARRMLTLPGDIPLVTAAEIGRLIAAHRPAPSFTIAPSHDEMGSNAILMSPPDAVKLRFGDDSFRPHLAAARAAGIEPTVVSLPGIALDIDNPADLAHFWQVGSRTRAGLWLAQHAGALASAGFRVPPAPGGRRSS